MLLKKMVLIGFLLITTLVFVRTVIQLRSRSLNLSDAEKYKNESERKIELNGSLNALGDSDLSSLIDVIHNSIFINVIVHDYLNYISVRISDDSGEPVYQAMMNTMVQMQTIICISYWRAGKYTICFTTGCGKHLSGKFEVNE